MMASDVKDWGSVGATGNDSKGTLVCDIFLVQALKATVENSAKLAEGANDAKRWQKAAGA